MTKSFQKSKRNTLRVIFLLAKVKLSEARKVKGGGNTGLVYEDWINNYAKYEYQPQLG